MKPFTSTFTLFALALRRERVRLSVWVASLVAFMAWFPTMVRGLLGTETGLHTFVELYTTNPVMRLFGLASGGTLGAFLVTRTHIIFAVGVVLMSVFIVVRNTRKAEEEGHTELVGSLAVGRHAGTLAALWLAASANAVLALLLAVVLAVQDLPFAGSLATGLSLGGLGLAFAAVAAVAAQFSATGRGANGMAMAIFGGSYLVAGLGNMLGHVAGDGLVLHSAWPAWLSPFGWSQQVRPFGGDHWWVLAITVAFTAAMALLAFFLEARRDMGQSLLPQRSGPATASPLLLGPTRLAWRLQRSAFIGWAIAVGILCLVYGMVSKEIEGLLEELGDVVEVVFGAEETLMEGYFTVIMGLMGILASAYALQTVLRMRGEERGGTLEPILGTAVSRTRWMLAHTANAVGGVVGLLLVAGLTAGVTAAAVLGEPGRWIPTLLQAALVQAPATLVLGGLATLAFATLPRWSAAASWSVLAAAVLLGPIFGPLLDLPQWLQRISPFTHTPAAPSDSVTALAPVVLLAVATMLAAGGALWFRWRDIKGGY